MQVLIILVYIIPSQAKNNNMHQRPPTREPHSRMVSVISDIICTAEFPASFSGRNDTGEVGRVETQG